MILGLKSNQYFLFRGKGGGINILYIKMNEFYVGWGGEGHAIKNLRLV